MPSKKSNKGKKSEKPSAPKRADPDEAFEKMLQDESKKDTDQNKLSKKPPLKCSQWTQEASWLDVVLFVGQKVRTEDIRDIKYTDQSCELQLSDGREWHMHFYQPIEKTDCRIQLKGIRIQLRVKKKVPGNWLDLEYIPGQSDKLSPAKKKPLQNPEETVNVQNMGKSEDSKMRPSSTQENKPEEPIKDSVSVVSDTREVTGEDKTSTVTVETGTNADGLFEEHKPDLADLVEDPKSSNKDAQEPQQAGHEEMYRLLHVKNDYYEKTLLNPNDTVTVQIFVKNIAKDSLEVMFKGRNVSVKFKTTNTTFLGLHEGTDENTTFYWAVEVVADLLESQCKYKLTTNHLELTLRKLEAKRWCALEAVHLQGKVQTSSDWMDAARMKTTAKVPPNNTASAATHTKSQCVFDEMEDLENNKRSGDKRVNPESTSSPSKASVLRESSHNKANIQKPTCMVSPLKPPKEKQVITPGYTGLDNLGNTCFMNSVLQVLANTRELKDYFLECNFHKEINVDNPLGSQGKLASEFALLLQKIWSGTKISYAPTNLKKLIAQKKSMFSGFAQHDAQEYMSYLLDGLHEDVNRVRKKPYIEQVDSDGMKDEEVANESWDNHKKRNDSFLVDLFQGQFKSKLVCPACQKVSVTFDPFMHLPVPLPKKQKVLPVMFMSHDPRRRPVQMMVKVAKDATIEVLKQAVAEKTGVQAKNLCVFEAYRSKVHAVFDKRMSLNEVAVSDTIIVHEVLAPEIAGEPMNELIVIQRLSIPRNKPLRCACCGKDTKVGLTLLRCTGCYRVGYCDIKCQKEDWQRHKVSCRCQPDNVGTPFLISLPKSQSTFSRISQMADNYSRYSVNVFQPPQSEQPASPAVGEPSSSCPSLSNSSMPVGLDSETLTKCTDEKEENSQTCSAVGSPTSTEPSTGSYDTVDSGRGDSVTMETGDPSKTEMTSSASSQDTESWSVGGGGSENSSGKESMSVSTSSTSLSTDVEDLQSEGDRETGEGEKPPVKQTRLVMGRQQDPEKPAPQFMLKPCDKDGHVLKGRKPLEDLGEEALPLDGVQFLAMEWKNNEKLRPFVQVETKDLVHTVDSSVNSMISEENKDITLQQCLSMFTEPETLSSEEAWYCPRCKQHREASKQMSLWRLPNILIIQLKRFSYRNLLWCDKVEKMVEFPTFGLDMSRFFSAHDGSASGQPAVYDLYGVVNHYGGILGGHYTSYVRCVENSGLRNEVALNLCTEADSKAQHQRQYQSLFVHGHSKVHCTTDTGWRLCDDSRVTKSSENQVVTQAAYVLFYRRRGMNLPLPDLSDIPQSLEYDVKDDDDEMSDEQTTKRPIFTISPERDAQNDSDDEKPQISRIFNTEYMSNQKQRPRSFSFSEGDMRSCDHGAGGDTENTDNKYIDSWNSLMQQKQQQQTSCTDMDSVD